MIETDQTRRALWITGAKTVTIRDEAMPLPGCDDVVLRTLYSGISRGTESLVYRGEVPETEWLRMAAPMQEGSFGFPVKYGYMSVGVVEAGPAELLGRAVFTLAPHQTRSVVPAAMAVPLPDALPPRRAALAANMETAVNILWDAMIRPGDRVAVIGAGVVGLLAAWLGRGVIGTEVLVVDVNPDRGEIAGALGLDFATPDALPSGFDCVIHTSASAPGLQTALSIAGTEATIIEASWYGAKILPLMLGSSFHADRLTIRSSQVGRIPPAQAARWTHRRRMELALRLLSDDRLDALISGETAFSDAAKDYGRVLENPATLAHVLAY